MSLILAPTPDNIARAADALRSGGVIGLPTETVYGLGANAYDERAVANIFKIKGRPSHNPLIVHISSLERISLAADPDAAKAAEPILKKLGRFIPGALSFVIARNDKIAPSVCAGLNTVAIRIPSHTVAHALLAQCEFPVAAPSANPSNYISPTLAEHVAAQLDSALEIILDGGACQVGLESTILDLSGAEPKILRQGQVTAEQISEATGIPATSLLRKEDRILAPGMLREHYSPRTPLSLLGKIGAIPARCGLLYLNAQRPPTLCANVHISRALSASGDLEEIARNLFKSMREFDSLGLDLIVVEECQPVGIGRAILDRLTRASAKTVR